MFPIQHKYIPVAFNSENTIFHYCDTDTAIKNILFDLELRLSPRNNSNDPLENTKPFHSIGSWGKDDTKLASEKDLDKVRKSTIKKLGQLKQVCFCMNDASVDSSNSEMLLYEYYGFLKPRMWDQYGDNYRGVCLAFSKIDLLKSDDLIPKPVQYFKYEHLRLQESIKSNHLKEQGFDEYFDQYFSRVEEKTFRKHQDYSGENEFRICTYSDNKHDFIDISEALIGIIVPVNKLSIFDLSILEKYSRDLNVDLIKVDWNSDRLIIISDSVNN